MERCEHVIVFHRETRNIRLFTMRLWVRRGFALPRQPANEEVIGQDDNLLDNTHIIIKKLDDNGKSPVVVAT